MHTLFVALDASYSNLICNPPRFLSPPDEMAASDWIGKLNDQIPLDVVTTNKYTARNQQIDIGLHKKYLIQYNDK